MMRLCCPVFSMLLMGLLLLGCMGIVIVPTPEAATERMFPLPAQVRQVYAVKPAFEDAVVVVFWRPEVPPNDPAEITFGYALVTQIRQYGVSSWQAQGGTALTTVPGENDRVLYFAGRQPARPHPIVFGYVLDPTIATVEVRFAAGQPARDRVSRRLFAAVAAADTPPCEIRLFDDAGHLVELIDLADATTFPLPSLPPELWDRARVECSTSGDTGGK